MEHPGRRLLSTKIDDPVYVAINTEGVYVIDRDDFVSGDCISAVHGSGIMTMENGINMCAYPLANQDIKSNPKSDRTTINHSIGVYYCASKS